MELGAAIMVGVPIFATRRPLDLTLCQYVTVVPGMADALRIVANSRPKTRPEGFLIDPDASLEEAHHIIERVGTVLARRNTTVDSAGEVYGGITDLRTMLRGLPAYTH
jgi:hypothetical protein